jgi:hypothetical protein
MNTQAQIEQSLKEKIIKLDKDLEESKKTVRSK